MAELLAGAREFAATTDIFVAWFDQVVSDERPLVSLRRLHEILGLLQAAAARLRAMAPRDEAGLEFENSRDSTDVLRKNLPVDAYSVVFNPFEYDATDVNPPIPVMATISDDLRSAAWLKQAPKTQDLCIPGIGGGDIMLRLDSQTYKIIGAYVCP